MLGHAHGTTGNEFFSIFPILLLAAGSVIRGPAAAIYVTLLFQRAVSRATILMVGLTLVAISGVNLFLPQRRQTMSKLTPSLLDDAVFNSEVTIGFFCGPPYLRV
jgi:hypothetical protein